MAVARENEVTCVGVAAGVAAPDWRLDHPSSVRVLAFAPDGSILATASERNVRVWDIATGKCRWKAPAFPRRVEAASFAADGRTVLAAGRSREVVVYDASTGVERTRLAFDIGDLCSLSVAASGTTAAACGGQRTAVVWDVEG